MAYQTTYLHTRILLDIKGSTQNNGARSTQVGQLQAQTMHSRGTCAKIQEILHSITVWWHPSQAMQLGKPTWKEQCTQVESPHHCIGKEMKHVVDFTPQITKGMKLCTWPAPPKTKPWREDRPQHGCALALLESGTQRGWKLDQPPAGNQRWRFHNLDLFFLGKATRVTCMNEATTPPFTKPRMLFTISRNDSSWQSFSGPKTAS